MVKKARIKCACCWRSGSEFKQVLLPQIKLSLTSLKDRFTQHFEKFAQEMTKIPLKILISFLRSKALAFIL